MDTETITQLRAYRYELKPNVGQRKLFAQHAGVARFAFNWGLARRIRYYRLFKKSVSGFTLRKHLNKFKSRRFPWMLDVSVWAVQSSLDNLDKAFAGFFTGLKSGRKVGFPKFKKKGGRDSFRLYGSIHVHDRHIQLPRIGAVRLKETPKVADRIVSVTVSREADRWFVSILTEQKAVVPTPNTKSACGIDLGLNSFATIAAERSGGELKIRKVKAPKPLAVAMKRLKRAQRKISRKQKGSANRKKAVLRVARIHRKVRNIRQDFLHKLSREVTKNHGIIRVETLNVKGMMSGTLAKSLSDVGMSEFVRQLEYKAKWYGNTVEKADRFYPSSKLCSSCGYKMKDMPLSIREWTCPQCGAVHDRDENSAVNLLRQTTVRTTESNASGLFVGGGTASVPVYESRQAERGKEKAEKPTLGNRRKRFHPRAPVSV